MKYELDTIPVWEALNKQGECLLCDLEATSRQRTLKYFLGGSVMVPETRMKINEHGFSKENAYLLNRDSNRQGLGLILSTRFKTILSEWKVKNKRIIESAKKTMAKNPLENLLSNNSGFKKDFEDLKQWIEDLKNSCLVNEKLEEDLNRYAYTFVQLWNQDEDFRGKWKVSKGICLNHLSRVLGFAFENLSGKKLGEFVLESFVQMDENLMRVFNDIMAFTKTFDSTGSHQVLGNPEKAIERTLQKIYGSAAGSIENEKNR